MLQRSTCSGKLVIGEDSASIKQSASRGKPLIKHDAAKNKCPANQCKRGNFSDVRSVLQNLRTSVKGAILVTLEVSSKMHKLHQELYKKTTMMLADEMETHIYRKPGRSFKSFTLEILKAFSTLECRVSPSAQIEL